MPDFDISQYTITVSMDEEVPSEEEEEEESEEVNSEETVQLIVKEVHFVEEKVEEGVKEERREEVVKIVKEEQIVVEFKSEVWAEWLFAQIYENLNTRADKVALVEEVSEARCVTYQELLEDVMRIANYLEHHGIQKNTKVGLCMESCVEMITYQLAFFLIGAVPVLFNPGHVASDRVNKVEAKVIVVDTEHFGHILRTFDKWTNLQQVFIMTTDIASVFIPRNVWVYDGYGYIDFPKEYHKHLPDVKGTVVAFATSGTSSSKGKIVGHNSSSAQLLCTQYYSEVLSLLSEKHPEVQENNIHHIITSGLYSIEGWSYVIHSLIKGHTAVITENNADVWRVSFLDRIAALIEQYKIPLIMTHSQLLNCFVKYEVQKLYNLSSLKMICHSGSTIPQAIISGITEVLDVSITQAYVSTELGFVGFDEILTSDDVICSIGEPFLGVDVRVASLEDETELPPENWGRIMVRGPTLLCEYLCDGSPKNYISKSGWFRTDDYGKLDERARLFVAGPISGVITVNDQQIALQAVENVLISHLSVEDVVVAEIDIEFTAGIVLKEGEVPPSTDALNKLLKEKSLKLNIAKVVLVDFIPRSETGKTLRLEIPFLLKSEDLFETNESSI